VKAPTVTSYDVARQAGVSQSAVSRAFREGGSVAPATRARILESARRLGYQPDAIARSLITRKSGLVAIVISNLTTLHYPEVLSALTARLSERGIRVLLFTLPNESDIDATLDELWRYRVDGAIFAARLSGAQIGALARRGVATVLYNRWSEDAAVASVCCDFTAGEAVLIDGLVAGGARAFGIIAGPVDSTVGEARVQGALARLAAAGIDPGAPERGDFSYDAGRAAARRLLEVRPLDAIVCANDTLALGAMDAARIDLGLAVPTDLSVVGFDGVAPARWAAYELTTVRQPVGRMAAAAVAMLIERIADPGLGAERRLFSGDLIRGRTARLA